MLQRRHAFVVTKRSVETILSEAATDLEKKIIKQNEVRTTTIRRSEPFVACSLSQKLDLQAIFLFYFPSRYLSNRALFPCLYSLI